MGATLICSLNKITSHGVYNAKGVKILVRNNFDCVVDESVIDTNGRLEILRVIATRNKRNRGQGQKKSILLILCQFEGLEGLKSS